MTVKNKNDEQKITLTNKRTGVTDAVWYKQWYDIYMYGSGSRPDIYLDIYRTVHTSAAEDGIETELDLSQLPLDKRGPAPAGDGGAVRGSRRSRGVRSPAPPPGITDLRTGSISGGPS